MSVQVDGTDGQPSMLRPDHVDGSLKAPEQQLLDWVTVQLWRPVGRLRQQVLRCPPLALKKVAGSTISGSTGD